MNLSGCANCLLHGWKQVEDESTLQQCTKCKLIKYCGKDCQSEHWKRIHKKQCKYFADPVKAQVWGHKEDDCAICLQSRKVGKADLRRASNPNYECIFKEKFPPLMYHPHPFPVTGQPEHTLEKAIIVLWQLLKKLELSQPGVIGNCRGELAKVFAELKMIRLDIWKVRKISLQSQCLRLQNYCPPSLDDLLDAIKEKVGNTQSVEDPFQLWKIIELLNSMLLNVHLSEHLQISLNPLADIPADLQQIVWPALSNSVKFLAMSNRVLEALASQVIPYQDVLKIICGDTMEKTCNFCFQKTSIADIGGFCGKESTVFFNCLFMEIYRCGGVNCHMKGYSMLEGYFRFEAALKATVRERESAQCDFCLKLPPAKGGHRYSKCLAVMYCGTTCRDQDWKIHKEFCNKDAKERKIKFGSSGRRKEARDALEQVQKDMENITVEGMNVQGLCEVVSKFRLKDA